MITIKNSYAIEAMTTAGRLLAEIFERIPAYLVPGRSTLEIDSWIAQQLDAVKLVSQSKGYMGYRHVSCISINDEIVHGVPQEARIITAGDLVKIDVCAAWKGYCADMARCYFVGGKSSAGAQALVDAAYEALDDGIEQAVEGHHVGDISAAIQKKVEACGFGVVRDFAGHGIGKRMHEDPEILNYGKPGRGPVIQVGMAFAIEPMITAGDYALEVLDDGWTARTVDRSLAAHVEDTVIVTKDGPRVVTRLS